MKKPNKPKFKLPAQKIVLFTIVSIIALLGILHRPILTYAGDYLKLGCLPGSLPAKADAIIVLGGEIEGERTRKGAELYKAGKAPKLILSDGTRMSWRTMAVDEMVALALYTGVPKHDILVENESRSTYENAVYTKKLMTDKRLDSAVVVTSDWHERRTKFIFDKVYQGSGIELSYCGAPDSRSDFDEWWKDGEKQQTVLTEWSKLLVYWAKYAF
ncbi:YdcF family protein [Paenibacillus thermotolerans]|uniref:YdcF family protein n=1 Tax=Paenibacillus thermotolerans TaxID=3027807 RepID=UPI002368D1D4|nr:MULTISPECIES: YdcF family protein [unclassified Paenibacillus]